MFPILYTIGVAILQIIATPILIFLSFKTKYRKSIPARFFLWRNRKQKIANGFWFHGCSLGEINALKPFILELAKIEKISLTTTTEAGFNSAKGFHTSSQFLPFETNLFFWIKPQKTLIVLEAELWFLLFFVAKLKGAKTVLLSGRISDRSYPKYLKAKWFYSKIFSNIDIVLAQSEIDKNRFSSLGAKNIEVFGNIKLLKSQKSQDLLIPKDKIVIVGASTHSKDEINILNAFAEFGEGRLILVPRHKERFDEVAKIIEDFIENKSYTFSRYSEIPDFQQDIILIDQMGILTNIYAKSDVVILGGGFYDGIGGHNPVEPASFQNKIISGKYMFNQNELLKYISNIQIVEYSEIGKTLKNIHNIPNSQILQNIYLEKIISKLKTV